MMNLLTLENELFPVWKHSRKLTKSITVHKKKITCSETSKLCIDVVLKDLRSLVF